MKIKHFCVYFQILFILLILGCNNNQQNQSTISVFGTGTVFVQPDVIQMSIRLSNVAETTRIAQESVSRMVRQALTILDEAGIEDNNISTASLTFRSEYEWTNRRILVGQRAEQELTFSVDNINNNNENSNVSRIIDQLIQINGIELNQINFGVKDSAEYFIRSRELAFQKAVEKANQYAELSGLKIIRVLSISEGVNQQISPISNRLTNQLQDTSASREASSTILPTGELEITTNISVIFVLE
jgi:uncharacterized protein YggE